MKVYFAGSSAFALDAKILRTIECNYMLQSFYSIKNFEKIPWAHLKEFTNVIIDSGLFSIMFGCAKDTVFDEKFVEQYYLKYKAFINLYKYSNVAFVEMDVQKKLGSSLAWELRKRLKKDCKGRQFINVYHLEDENPDKLIDFSDYMAVSIPELRKNVTRKELIRITRYIVTKALTKNKKVHLLGCTEATLLKTFSMATSCDSSSWRSCGRYGGWKPPWSKNKIRVENLERMSSMDTRFEKAGAGQGALCLQHYKQLAGDQS